MSEDQDTVFHLHSPHFVGDSFHFVHTACGHERTHPGVATTTEVHLVNCKSCKRTAVYVKRARIARQECEH